MRIIHCTTHYAIRCVVEWLLRYGPSLKVSTLTPYYVHAIQDHQKKQRPQPQGTYADALLALAYG